LDLLTSFLRCTHGSDVTAQARRERRTWNPGPGSVMDERAPHTNAEGTGEVPEHRCSISCATKTSRQRRTYLLVKRMQETVMPLVRGLRISSLAIAASLALDATSALASQGPGVESGTASPLTQLVMAILVYGASAVIVGAGLIGALRGH